MQFAYTIVYVPDVAAAVAFYETAFSVPRRFLHESGMYAEMETGATALAFAHEQMADTHGITIHKQRSGATPVGVEICFVTENPEQAYAHALAQGAVAVSAPEAKPWGQIVSYVRDLNGYLVEICSAVTS